MSVQTRRSRCRTAGRSVYHVARFLRKNLRKWHYENDSRVVFHLGSTGGLFIGCFRYERLTAPNGTSGSCTKDLTTRAACTPAYAMSQVQSSDTLTFNDGTITINRSIQFEGDNSSDS